MSECYAQGVQVQTVWVTVCGCDAVSSVEEVADDRAA